MYCIWFKDCSYENKNLVGGKSSSLGELWRISKDIGFSIGDGFALTIEMYDEFIEDLNEVNTTKRHVENDLYIMTYNKSAVNVLFKSGNTSIRFDDESVKTLNEALNTE